MKNMDCIKIDFYRYNNTKLILVLLYCQCLNLLSPYGNLPCKFLKTLHLLYFLSCQINNDDYFKFVILIFFFLNGNTVTVILEYLHGYSYN